MGSHTALSPVPRAPAGNGLLELGKDSKAYSEIRQVKLEPSVGKELVW
jgi:hypothetical protein